MPRLIWSLRSRVDLRRIDAWLTSNASWDIAAKTLVSIQRQTDLLLAHPLAGPAAGRVRRSLRVHGTRYILIYRVSKARIEIVRIRHEREDWRNDVDEVD